MSTLRKLQRDRAEADLSAVTGLLDTLDESDWLTRASLEARRTEILDTIGVATADDPEKSASTALFFGGRPVVADRGIESEFAGAALAKFQDLVAKVLAQGTGPLGRRGVVPNKAASTLHVTDIARGSFGFILEEVLPQAEMIETPLTAAVERVASLFDALGEANEEQFQRAVEDSDNRVLGTTKEFFELLRDSGATLRLITGSVDEHFDEKAIERAILRATSTTLEDEDETLSGTLIGILPEGHLFEMHLTNPERTIRGKIDRGFSAEALIQINQTLLNRPVIARMQSKRVLRDGDTVRESFVLLEVNPDLPQTFRLGGGTTSSDFGQETAGL